jgi:hypothetical protein
MHLLYLIALLAICLATFGARGTVLAAVICIVWGFVVFNRHWPMVIALSGVFLVISCCLTAFLLLPAVEAAQEAARRMQCSGNLCAISLGLHNYHDHYGCFPPAIVKDADGKPMHSWRVLLLPFLSEYNLYNKYRMDEPWDGPNNRKLLGSMPSVYRCPSAGHDGKSSRECASYLAVVGLNGRPR